MTTQRELSISLKLDELRAASIQKILQNQATSGAYIASPSFKVYNYSWFRDGSFIADAMLESGEVESATRFHEWVVNTILSRREKIEDLIDRRQKNIEISPDEHLHCRYTVEGAEASESWTNFQLDGFGTWIWSLHRYQQAVSTINKSQVEAVELLIDYLNCFWQDPSFDWWEESFGFQHISTLGCISAGLKAASQLNFIDSKAASTALKISLDITNFILLHGVHNGRLTKWAGDSGLDASLSSLISPLKLFASDSEISIKTITAIDESLGRLGTYRHKDDVYFGGGRWIILSAFLGLAHIEIGDYEKAREILEWILEAADEDLNLPEQLPSPLLHPEHRDGWIGKWGEPANPLLWSHAMYLKLLASLQRNEGPVI